MQRATLSLRAPTGRSSPRPAGGKRTSQDYGEDADGDENEEVDEDEQTSAFRPRVREGSKLTAALLAKSAGAPAARGGTVGGKDGKDGDVASEGGGSVGSAQSGVSATSGVSSSQPGGHSADYKRGKRYRKLCKLMDSPQAQGVLLQFKRHSMVSLAALAALHVVCFALIVAFLAVSVCHTP